MYLAYNNCFSYLFCRIHDFLFLCYILLALLEIETSSRKQCVVNETVIRGDSADFARSLRRVSGENVGGIYKREDSAAV